MNILQDYNDSILQMSYIIKFTLLIVVCEMHAVLSICNPENNGLCDKSFSIVMGTWLSSFFS